MLSFLSKALYGALTLSAMLVIPAELKAHAPVPVTVTVEDSAGAALSGASVKQASGALLGRTDTSGRLTFNCDMPCQIRVDAEGFKGKDVEISANTTISLEPAAATQQVTVTAYRTPLGELESPVSTRTLLPVELQTAAPITMDGQVRQLPGVELFRRSSSLVANPTSQGISLRGLGSTSASRTLVTSDDVPLNDPLGGWIHWEEQPELAVSSIDVVRGGASDLYGSSAIGGVMNVGIVRPTATMAELRSSYGMLGTYDASGLAETKHGPWGVMGAGGALGTDGFIQEAPWQRGPVDINSNVHAQNGLLLGEHDRGPLRLFVRGSGFNEDRSNGTPYQVNGTSLWRYAAGGDWQGPHDGSLAARLYGSDEHYHQTFSSISNLPKFGDPTCSYRCGEIPTRYSQIPDNELGAAALWSQPLGAGLLLLAGADVHDVRVWDREQLFGSSAALTNLSVHQRDTGLYSEALWTRKGWTVAGSVRVDWFRNFDGQPNALDRNRLGASADPTANPRTEPLRSAPGCLAQAGAALGPLGVGLSGVSRSHAQRALPLHPGGQPAHPAQLIAPERARHRMGNRRGLAMALGHHPRQLLPHPDQPPHSRGHPQSQLFAHPAHARESRPDREQRFFS